MGKEYYVGPEKWPKWIRRFLSFRELNECAKYHDIAYSENSKLSKKRADNMFKACMEVKIRKHPSGAKRIWLRVVAKMYYIIVKKFGKNNYKGRIK